MASNRTCISHLGLPPREAAVLQSLFQLVPTLQASFELVERADGADVVFINTSDRDAVAAWQRIARRNELAVPVRIVDRDAAAGAGLAVRRPLVLRKLLRVLEEITSTDGATPARRSESEYRILVVADSFPVRKYFEHTLPRLSAAPASVDLAESGAEAQSKLLEQRFDLVFLDNALPDTDGFKLCRWMKSHDLLLPAVLMTGRRGGIDKMRAAIAGCDALLRKPPGDERIRELLERFIPADATPALESA